MTFTYPGIDKVFSTSETMVDCLVIENRRLFYELLTDCYSQIQGNNGKTVLSENGTIIDFSKNAELLASFIPFEINQKPLLSKIISRFEKRAYSAEYCEKTAEMLAGIERYLDSLADDCPMDLQYKKLNVASILKSVGVEIVEDGDSLPETIINYMSLVREYDCDKLFIIVNLRAFIDDSSAEMFMESVCRHKYKVLLLESNSYERLKCENRYTVDNDLCEF